VPNERVQQLLVVVDQTSKSYSNFDALRVYVAAWPPLPCSNNGLDSASATAIGNALAAVTSLTSLDVRCAAPRERERMGLLFAAHLNLPGLPCLPPVMLVIRLHSHTPRNKQCVSLYSNPPRPCRGQDLADGVWAVISALLPRAAHFEVWLNLCINFLPCTACIVRPLVRA
jgi:hypothetical protein